MHHYLVYGLRLRADRAVPGFPPPVEDEAFDVEVVYDEVQSAEADACRTWMPHPTLRHRDGDAATLVVQQSGDGSTALHWGDGARFVISPERDRVHVVRPDGMSHDSISTYLVNTVLALCLRHRGITCLHASGVDVQGRAVLFVAPSGSGKSTLAFALSRRGHSLLTDDVAAVAGDPVEVRPGYPRIRLWPWTVEGLLGDGDALPRICDDWEKRAADADDFDTRARPLGAVVLLEGYAEAPVLRRLSDVEALAGLMRNVSLDKILDEEGRRSDFASLSRVVESVPVLALVRPHDLTTVAESADAVVRWLDSQET